MPSALIASYASRVAERGPWIALGLVVLTALVAAGAGIGERQKGDIGEVSMHSPAHEAGDVIAATYASRQHIESYAVIREGRAAVPTRAELLAGLRLQAELVAHPDVAPTLVHADGIVGLENVVGRAACALLADHEAGNVKATSLPRQEGSRVQLAPCDRQAQMRSLQRLPEAVFDRLVAAVIDPKTAPADRNPQRFLPVEAGDGEPVEHARAMLVAQRNPNSAPVTPEAVRHAQVVIDGMLAERFGDAFLYGQGVAKAESSRAVGDSFRLILPVALVLLAVVLLWVLRDAFDIALALLGITLVVLWLQGIQGWLAIPSTSILIAVPFLLVGLAIDYAMHVTMRYREAGERLTLSPNDSGQPLASRAMALGLASVLPTLAISAISTAVGFLSNSFSPLASIRDFALVSSLGILATLLVFASLIPALKAMMEAWLQRRGHARRRRALGRAPGMLNRALLAAASCGVRWPWRVSCAAVALSLAGLVAAFGIDTSFKQTDFLPSKPPQWMQSLPEAFAPADYSVKEDRQYLLDHFGLIARLMEAEILLRGEVTSPDMLRSIELVSRRATMYGAVVTDSPAALIRLAARSDAAFSAALFERDDDGDGLPDRDIGALYDRLFELAPDRAAAVLYREDGDYRSARLPIALLLNASAQDLAQELGKVAEAIEALAPVTAVATGRPVITARVQTALFSTLIVGFAVTLAVITGLLCLVYRVRWRSPGMGVILVLPVVAALACLLGLMRLLAIPFNSETVVITSLAIGIGVDYSVHIGDRFMSLRLDEPGATLREVMARVLTGTGGAVLGSAATTVCGFGVLAIGTSPPLQRFGLVTGMAILLAFLATTLLLPSLLVLRDRWLLSRS